MKNFIYFVFFFVSTSSFGQFSESFSDSDYPLSHTWNGDVDKFHVNPELQLQLNAPKDGSPAQLFLPSRRVANTSWEFWIKMNFNPTSSNYVKIYLCSDAPDLTGALEGLYIRIGHTKKNVCLLAQSGTSSRTLISGGEKRTDKSSVALRVKAVLTADGIFGLYTKYDDEISYMLEGSCNISAFPGSNYFGLVCIYTSTRNQHFFFDDLDVKIIDETKEGGSTGIGKVEVCPDITSGTFQIRYNLPFSGSRCRAMIFDSMGRSVCKIANNETLGSEGFLNWDGRSESGQNLRPGIYIFYMEVYHDRGQVKKYKMPIVVRQPN